MGLPVAPFNRLEASINALCPMHVAAAGYQRETVEARYQTTLKRPYLIRCYDRKEFPRTNNELERNIRGLKTQYRRISGRKNWNNYLLCYGRFLASLEVRWAAASPTSSLP